MNNSTSIIYRIMLDLSTKNIDRSNITTKIFFLKSTSKAKCYICVKSMTTFPRVQTTINHG